MNEEFKSELKKILADPEKGPVLMEAIAEINTEKKDKIARSTCVRCHVIFPRTEMVHAEVSEHAGSSWGVSKSMNNKSNPTLSYRSYKRKRREWVCNTCYEPDRREAEIMLNMFYICLWGFLGLVAFLIFAAAVS